MSSTTPKESTIKALFARSGNECAFEGCSEPIVQNNNCVIGEICHIEARKLGGPRYNPHSNDEERRSFENLIILCPNHHRIIDNNEKQYTVINLKKMKNNHENKREKFKYKIDHRIVGNLILNSGYYRESFNTLRTVATYNALKTLYNPECISPFESRDIQFIISDSLNKFIAITMDSDSKKINESLYIMEKKLSGIDSLKFEKVVCFVYCDSLIDKRYHRENNKVRLNNSASIFFNILKLISKNYYLNMNFVFLIEDLRHPEKFRFLNFISDSDKFEIKLSDLPINLNKHTEFLKSAVKKEYTDCLLTYFDNTGGHIQNYHENIYNLIDSYENQQNTYNN
ncbi:HNH endonuclease [Rheinheimera fenheensis]|uniref:HNH endonuclease n=1 Tax=Rheinheimera fenheensis TaxID=3152295 RepID=UPI00325C47E0